MRNSGNTAKILIILFGSLFIANMAVMYAFFDVNVLYPVYKGGTISKTAVSGVEDPMHSEDGTTTGGADTAGDAAAEAEGINRMADDMAAEAEGINRTAGGGLNSVYDEYPDGSTPPNPSAYFLTPSEAGCLGGLGLADKISALSLISRIGSAETDRIYEMAGDGITYAEMDEIKATLEKYLSKDDMDILYNLLDKGKKLYAAGFSSQND